MFDICLLLYGDWRVFLVNVYVFIYFLYSLDYRFVEYFYFKISHDKIRVNRLKLIKL